MSRDSALALTTVPSDAPSPHRIPPPVIIIPPGVVAGVTYGALTARYLVAPRTKRRGAGHEPGGWKVRCARCGQAHVLPEVLVRRGTCPTQN